MLIVLSLKPNTVDFKQPPKHSPTSYIPLFSCIINTNNLIALIVSVKDKWYNSFIVKGEIVLVGFREAEWKEKL